MSGRTPERKQATLEADEPKPDPAAVDAAIAALWKEFKETKDPPLRERLILHYSPLVKYVAGRVGAGLPPNIEQADLVSYGIFGLIDAIVKFDISRAIKFETYAISRIKGAIIDELRAIDWIPRSVRYKAREVEKAYAALESRPDAGFAYTDAWLLQDDNGRFYRNAFGISKMNQSLSILTGATAGATESFVVVPFELPLSNSSTVALGSAVPDSETAALFCRVSVDGEVMSGAAGGVVSIRTVRAFDTPEVLPAASLAFAV